MKRYVPERPPVAETADGQNLGEYLGRQTLSIAESIDTVHDWDEAVPFQGRAVDGMVRYSEGDVTDFKEGPGLYLYRAGEWRRLAEAGEVVEAGYGGLYRLVPGTSTLTTITPTPQTVLGYDTQLTPELAVVSDLLAGTLQLTETGIWSVNFLATFEVVASSANETREVEVGFYDDTNGVQVDILADVSIPRYGAVATLSGTVLAKIEQAATGIDYSAVIYSPSGHIITISQINNLDFSVNRVSEPGAVTT